MFKKCTLNDFAFKCYVFVEKKYEIILIRYSLKRKQSYLLLHEHEQLLYEQGA